MKSILLTIASLLFVIQNVYTMTVDVRPGQVDCYYETLDVGEKITVSYQVRFFDSSVFLIRD